ncbi:MAG: sugar phosphate isomerase/epimerase [Planctomycetes bacterium]|nr:sugar phosphate isomerase/epimerase [Planctomycetota bacterium]MCH9727349.1 sugar phosphate isomerase/epimerase [Planctomycetota bacterium]MCH9776991.1 sugar phosphate isomerase/epimerase [Planctomycetota bacterium]MCH9791895.1 sugar phosphate isomerase/epimerase [Planctomycetota bacterium]
MAVDSPTPFHHESNRRDFLKSSSLWGWGALTAGTLISDTTLAAGVQKKDAAKKLKLSLAAYSFHRYMQHNWPKPRPRKTKATMDIMDFVRYCGKLKLDGCELTSYYFPNPVSTDYLKKTRDLAGSLGMEVSGTAIGNDFCLPLGTARDEQLQMTRKWIDYSAILGAPVIRIFAGRVPKGGNEAEAIKMCQKGINESLKYAEQKGVSLALENHGGITSTPAQMMRIIDGVNKAPNFGINFDSGNFRTEDPYADLKQIAPLAINAQIKVEMGVRGKEVPADIPRIVKILKDAHYKNFLVLEYEAKEEPKAAIPTYINQLRKLA